MKIPSELIPKCQHCGKPLTMNLQSEMALKSGMNFVGKPIEFKLTDSFGLGIPQNELYVPHYGKNCDKCGSKLICNGCSDCGRCK